MSGQEVQSADFVIYTLENAIRYLQEGDNETALKCILQAATDLEYVIEENKNGN
jgi:hypothetical protein